MHRREAVWSSVPSLPTRKKLEGAEGDDDDGMAAAMVSEHDVRGEIVMGFPTGLRHCVSLVTIFNEWLKTSTVRWLGL